MPRIPLTEEQRRQRDLARQKVYRDNLSPEKRAHMAERKRLWEAKRSAESKARHKAKKKIWAQNNPEKMLEAQKRYRAKLSPEQIARQRASEKRYAERVFGKGSSKVEPMHAASLAANEMWAAANAAVSRYLPDDVRCDVISSIILAALEGEISIDEIPSVGKNYTTQHYREFSKYRTVSLDEPIHEGSKKSAIEAITSDAFHF